MIMNLPAASRRGIIMELLIIFSAAAENTLFPCPPFGGLNTNQVGINYYHYIR